MTPSVSEPAVLGEPPPAPVAEERDDALEKGRMFAPSEVEELIRVRVSRLNKVWRRKLEDAVAQAVRETARSIRFGDTANE